MVACLSIAYVIRLELNRSILSTGLNEWGG